MSDMFTKLANSLQACMTAYRKKPKDEVATDYVHDADSDLFKKNLSRANQVSEILNAMCQDVHKFTSPELYAAFNFEGIAGNFGKLAGKVETWERRSPKELDLMARAMHLLDVPVPASTVVDTVEKVQEMIMVICAADVSARDEPNLTFDLEGLNLGHTGTISLFQIHIRSIDHVFLLDVATLERELRSIPPSSSAELWSPCARDSEALKALYHISLAGVIDVQLMDVITRRCNKKERSTVKSLSMSLPTRLNKTLSDATLANWSAAKYWGRQAMRGHLEEALAEYEQFDGDSKAAKKAAKEMTPEVAAEYKLVKEEAKAATARTILRVNGCPMCCHKEDATEQVDCTIPATSSDSDSDTSPNSPLETDASSARPTPPTADTWSPVEIASPSKFEDSFAVRPLPRLLLEYAIGDVSLLHYLYLHFLNHERWNEHTAAAVTTETQRRLDLSQAEGVIRQMRALSVEATLRRRGGTKRYSRQRAQCRRDKNPAIEERRMECEWNESHGK